MKTSTRLLASLLFGACCCLVPGTARAAMPYDFEFAGDVPPTPLVGYLERQTIRDLDPADNPVRLDTCPTCGTRACCCCWKIWADAQFWSRSSARNTSLVYEDPKGPEIYEANDLDFAYGWGPRLGVTRCLDPCRSVSVEFFGFDGWSAGGQTFGNISVQFPSFPYLPELTDPTDPNSGYGVATFHYVSDLYSAEVNYLRRAGSVNWLTLLAGFRWMELSEDFGTVFETGGTAPNYWIDTNNHLYGFQLGALANLVDRGPWTVDSWLKAGVYGNAADQATYEDFTSAGGVTTYISARDSNVAFSGEVGMALRRQITNRLSARLSYMAMWLEGVALAPEQLDNSDPSNDIATLDNSGGIFYHGGFVGFEYLW